MKHKLMKKHTYSRVRSNKLVTAVGKGPTIDTAYTSLQTTKSQSYLHQLRIPQISSTTTELKNQNLFFHQFQKNTSFFFSKSSEELRDTMLTAR